MVNFRTLKMGDVVKVGYRDWDGDHDSEFLGFTDWNEAHGETPVFKDWKAVMEAKGVRTFADLHRIQYSREYGHVVYAVFQDMNPADASVFCAYLYNNRWCVGSSADPARLTQKVA